MLIRPCLAAGAGAAPGAALMPLMELTSPMSHGEAQRLWNRVSAGEPFPSFFEFLKLPPPTQAGWSGHIEPTSDLRISLRVASTRLSVDFTLRSEGSAATGAAAAAANDGIRVRPLFRGGLVREDVAAREQKPCHHRPTSLRPPRVGQYASTRSALLRRAAERFWC